MTSISPVHLKISLNLLLFVALCGTGPNAFGQDLGHEVPADTLAKYSVYDTDLLPPSFHADRRNAFLEWMQPGSAALFLAAPEQTRANDISYQYHQEPNLYYLSGCWESDCALLLTHEPISVGGKNVREVLFVRGRDPKTEVWTGHRLGPDGAIAVLHIPASLTTDSLESVMRRVLQSRKSLYLIRPRHKTEPLFSFDSSSTSPIYPDVRVLDPLVRMSELRMTKSEPELRLMRRAIAISNEAHNAAIRAVKPGWHEYNIQALAESVFTANGAEYTAYPCIVGSGENSTVLHYETNRRAMNAGDFIEMDMGAEYHGYAADVTRSYPVSPRFTPEQRAIYNLVLEAQDSGIAECQVGLHFADPHHAAVRVIAAGLVKLGITKDTADYRRYFMHGTSHYLGLDVHDIGNYTRPFSAGMVLTVEPGIYIAKGSPCDPKWWNIGCRIEDDILISQQGPQNLSSASPRTLDAVEALRNAAQ